MEIDSGVPVIYNHAELTSQLQPTLEAIYGGDSVFLSPPITGPEDFFFFQAQAPVLFFLIGGRPNDVPAKMAIPNQSPFFYADESALPLGVHAMSRLAVD